MQPEAADWADGTLDQRCVAAMFEVYGETIVARSGSVQILTRQSWQSLTRDLLLRAGRGSAPLLQPRKARPQVEARGVMAERARRPSAGQRAVI